MRPHWQALPILIPALAAALTLAAPSSDEARHELLDRRSEEVLFRRDGHEHMHNHYAEPKIHLNETELLLYHSPTPPSYWSIDFEDTTSDDARYPGLMGLHILFMSLAFFGALPAGESTSGYSREYRCSDFPTRHCAALREARVARLLCNPLLHFRNARIGLRRPVSEVDP